MSGRTTRKPASPACSGRPPCPYGVRVRGSHCVTIGAAGEIRITFHTAAVDLCYEEFEQLKDAIPFEGGEPPNAPGTRRAASLWYCGWGGVGEEGGNGRCGCVGRAELQRVGIGTGGG